MPDLEFDYLNENRTLSKFVVFIGTFKNSQQSLICVPNVTIAIGRKGVFSSQQYQSDSNKDSEDFTQV
jgi:hypothetical protein